MDNNITEERNEFQEDEEKLQSALQEFSAPWLTGAGDYRRYYHEISDSDMDDEEDEDDQLLIDLDNYEASEHEANSTTPSYVGSASQSQSLTAGEEESGDAVPRPNLELPSDINLIDYRADPQMTLYLNRNLQAILETHIKEIKEKLKENKEKQAKLEEDVTDSSTKTEKKGLYAGAFRAPYFRHVNSYPPSNDDVLLKKLSGDFDIGPLESFKDLRYFNKTAKKMLQDAVYQDCLENRLKPIVTKMEFEIKRLDKCQDDLKILKEKLEDETNYLTELKTATVAEDVESMIIEVTCTMEELKTNIDEKQKMVQEHKEEVARLEQMIENIRNTPQEEMLQNVDPEKVDWMKMAKNNFSGHSTWLDCQKAWEHLVNPAVNRKAWTKDEEKALLNLVKKSKTGDWSAIAKDLGTGRTAFQCFSLYQRHYNIELKPRPWSPEEDAKLVRVTNNVKDSIGFFSWSKVSTLMDSRSPIECMYRFTKIDPSQSKGRWTELEDVKLLAAVEMIGPCWAKVAKFIGTRNMVQCRDRYLNCLAPNINYTHFTYDEDIKLLKLYKKLGPAWAKMVPEFAGRTDSMLLGRFRQLQRWKQNYEWFEKQTDSTKRMLLGKSLSVPERQKFRARAEDYLREQLGVFTEDYKRQELDRQNGVDPDIIPPRPPRHLRCYTVGGPNRTGAFKKWSMKLDVHKRLTENLHRLLKKEEQAMNEKKGKGPQRMASEVSEEIMQRSVEETLNDKTKAKPKKHTKGQIKKLEEALNKVFLTAGTVSVQELIQASVVEKKRAKSLEKNTRLDAELKNILRRRGRTLSKLGRARRFFEKDTRPTRIIEEELDELDHSVPLILIKNLGTDVHFMYNASQLQCLQFQEELTKLPSYEEDVDFQGEEAETQRQIQKLLARTDITDQYKQQRLCVLKKKLRKLRSIFSEKRYLQNKVVENKVNTFRDDLDYMESLMDEKRESEVSKNWSLMICNPPGIVGINPEADMKESSTPVLLSASADNTSTIQVSKLPTPGTQSCSSSQTPSNEVLSSGSKADGEKSSGLKKDGEFAVPQGRPKKKRTRYNSRVYWNIEESEGRQFTPMTKEEIEGERRKIPILKKRIFVNLPFLPPCLSTLLGLRALFLMKQELIGSAGELYRPEHNRRNQTQRDTHNGMDGDGSNEFKNQTDNASSWFFNTTPQQLSEQASLFQGYMIHQRGPGRRTHIDHSQIRLPDDLSPNTDEQNAVTFGSEALMFPLEERGGRLPDSGSKAAHESDVDLKPVMCEQIAAQVNNSGKPNSGYQVVMGFTGYHAEEFTPFTATEKQTPNKAVPVSSVVQNSASLIPTGLIKTDTSEDGGELTRSTTFLGYAPSVNKDKTNNPSEMYSVHSATHSAADSSINNDEDDDDDGDVVAVIHLDDDGDDGTSQTVINICASKTGSVGSSSKDDDIVIVSDKNRPSQFMALPQETEQPVDLSNLTLPESKIKSIMSNSKVSRYKSHVVLVGVDQETKSIVHFKPKEDSFAAYEAIPTYVAEEGTGRHRSYCANFKRPPEEKPRITPDSIKAIRQTNEYKLLLARFHALFMWPALMSLVKPSPLNDGSLPTELSNYNALNNYKRLRKRKRLKSKQSAAKREHLRLIRQCSLRTRRIKQATERRQRSSRKRKIGHSKEESRTDATEQTANSLEQQSAVMATGTGECSRTSLEESATQAVHAENSVEQNGDNQACLEMSTETAKTDGEEPKPKRRRYGRPKGCKNKQYMVLRERSQRIKKKMEEQPPPVEPPKECIRSLPQWWKDAVLAAMLAKKAMADDGEKDTETNIEDDDDFIDTGDYSDDEWYRELREEETKEKIRLEQQRLEQERMKQLRLEQQNMQQESAEPQSTEQKSMEELDDSFTEEILPNSETENIITLE